jgi:hypothetical protein
MWTVRYYKNGDTDPLSVKQSNFDNEKAAIAAVRELRRDGFTVIEVGYPGVHIVWVDPTDFLRGYPCDPTT